MDSAAERNTDLSDGRPEGDESSSSPSAEAASLSADLVVVDGDFFVDWSAAVDGDSPAADGCYCDVASVHGTYRRVQDTVTALALPTRWLAAWGDGLFT